MSQTELDQLERVLLRFGLADSDEKLATTVGRFLCPVLLKCASTHVDVRKKTMEVLAHVSKQLKSRPKISMPTEDLLAQFENVAVSAMVRNFTLVYLKMALVRLTKAGQVALVPRLLNCLEGRPPAAQNTILQLVTPLMGAVELPESTAALASWLKLRERTALRNLLLGFWLDLLRLPYKKPALVPVAGDPSATQADVAAINGLTPAAYERLTASEYGVSLATLVDTKLGVVQFLAAGVFAAEDVACHLLIASADTQHKVAGRGDVHLKRLAGPDTWKSPAFVSRLYSVLLGSVAATPVQDLVSQIFTDEEPITPVQQKTFSMPASDFLVLGILPILLRSTESTAQTDNAVRTCLVCSISAQPKLRYQGMLYLQHVIETAPKEKVAEHSHALLKMVCSTSDAQKESTALRGHAFTALGKMSRRFPEPFRCENSKILGILFRELMETKDGDIRQSVYDCIMACIPALTPAPAVCSAAYEKYATKCIASDVARVRLLGLQFSIGVFGITHLSTIGMVLEATDDGDDAVRRACQRALYGVAEDRSAHGQLANLPDKSNVVPFSLLVEYCSSKCRGSLRNGPGHRTPEGSLPFSPLVLQQMLLYLHATMLCTADITKEELVLANYQKQLCKSFSSWTATAVSQSWMHAWTIMEYLLSMRSLSGEVHVSVFAFMADLFLAMPLPLADFVHRQRPLLLPYLTCPKEEIRSLVAKIVAGATVGCESDAIETFCNELMELLRSKEPEKQHGAMLALGSIIAGLPYNVHGDQQGIGVARDAVVSDFLLLTCDFLENASLPLYLAACQAIGDVACSMPLPLAAGDLAPVSGEPPAAKKPKTPTPPGHWTKATVIESLGKRIGKGNGSKLVEKSALTLASLLVGEPGLAHRQRILDVLLGGCKTTEPEIHFVVGEALSFVAVGSSSHAVPVCPLKYTSNPDREKAEVAFPHLKETLQAVVVLSKSDMDSTRQAACVCLLCFIQHCGHVPAFQEYLLDIQNVFVTMLTERNDIVQEVASRGLSLVFEHSPAEQREILLETLRDTLLKGRRSGRHVDKKTKVLGEEVVGKQPEGASLTTYEELCTMADNLNQPDLVYKFMNLANHHSIWNSKKGAAFGVSLIAQHCKEALQEHLGSIVPKLYTYTYDPNLKVRLAMTNIWKAVVTDPGRMVAQYFGAILDEIISGLTHPQWRIRQSCCMALAEFLRGVDIRKELVEALPLLWTECMRVRDDIKESVRTAADSACKSLSKVTIRICDSSRGENGKHAIALVLPIMMEKGMLSSVEEVKTISLATINQISKNAGTLLKPHIAKLVPMLIEGLTELEPKVLSYIALHVGAQSDEMQDKLDNARVAASKGSPLMDVANQCLHHVDKTVLCDLAPALVALLKTGVGLGTKAGCAQFVVSLCSKCRDDLTPYAGKLLHSLVNGLQSMSSGVRRSFAACTGHLVKVAKESSVSRLIAILSEWYLEKEEEELHHSAALTLQAMNRHANDVVQQHSSDILPLVFLAMHAKPKVSTQDEQNPLDTVALWQDIWQENTAGTEGGVRVHGEQIAKLLMKTVTTSSSWELKRQAAAGISTFCTKLGARLPDALRDPLLRSMITALDTPMWTGRHAVYQAAADVLRLPPSQGDSSGDAAATERLSLVTKLSDAMLAQCARKRYRQQALQSCSLFLSAVSVDRASTVQGIVAPLLALDSSGSNSDSDVEAGSSTVEKNHRQDQLYCSCFTLMGQAWPKKFNTFGEEDGKFMDLVLAHLAASSWKRRVAIWNSITEFASRCDTSTMDDRCKDAIKSPARQLLQYAAKNLTDQFQAVQAVALKAVESLVRMFGSGALRVLEEEEVNKLLLQQLSAMLQAATAAKLHERCRAMRDACVAAKPRGKSGDT